MNNFVEYRRWYHRQPRKWKKQNPAPHSCINCRYLHRTLCDQEMYSYISDIARYYPNECPVWKAKGEEA